jgi:hypothetical protein
MPGSLLGTNQRPCVRSIPKYFPADNLEFDQACPCWQLATALPYPAFYLAANACSIITVLFNATMHAKWQR